MPIHIAKKGAGFLAAHSQAPHVQYAAGIRPSLFEPGGTRGLSILYLSAFIR
jgi:hypothetical protein